MNQSDEAELALRMVREAKDLSFDTETSGTDWKRNFPVGWVIGGDVNNIMYVPTRHGGGGNLPDTRGIDHTPEAADSPYQPHQFEIELAKAFDDRNRLKVGRTIGHHIKFDCHFSANVGIMLGRDLTCSQNNQALLDEYTKSFALGAVAEMHGVTAKKGQELYEHLARLFGGVADRKQMANFWRTAGNDPIAVDYARGDGVTTLELLYAQEKDLIRDELETVWDVENRLIWTLFRMERRGVAVDRAYIEEMIKTIENRVDEAYQALPPKFNPRSSKQVREYVEQFATNWPTTEKGNPSFTEKWLKTFPEGKNIIAVRKWTNLANTFARPLLEEHQYEGRVHASLNQNKADDHGTIAGRLSCSKPNLQQIPKHDKELAKMFRAAFVADPGMKFYEADYSQCEPRLFAHYSQEPALVQGYSQEPFRDVHTVVAELFGVDRDTTGKRMNMGMFTGMFPKSFAGHMGVTVAEATELWNRWFAEFPEIRDFQNLAKRVMLQRGYVKTLLGRRGRLDKPRFAYKATSKIIQGGNADIMKYKMLEIDEHLEANGDQTHLLMMVHDSFLWQSPDTPAGEAEAAWIRETMLDVQSEPFNLRVPFAVDCDSGLNWKEASFGAED